MAENTNTVVFTQDELRLIRTSKANSFKHLLEETRKVMETAFHREVQRRAEMMWIAIKDYRQNKIVAIQANSICDACDGHYYTALKDPYCSTECQISATNPKSACKACLDGELNQQGHMYPGGCLYAESPELPPMPPFSMPPFNLQ